MYEKENIKCTPCEGTVAPPNTRVFVDELQGVINELNGRASALQLFLFGDEAPKANCSDKICCMDDAIRYCCQQSKNALDILRSVADRLGA